MRFTAERKTHGDPAFLHYREMQYALPSQIKKVYEQCSRDTEQSECLNSSHGSHCITAAEGEFARRGVGPPLSCLSVLPVTRLSAGYGTIPASLNNTLEET